MMMMYLYEYDTGPKDSKTIKEKSYLFLIYRKGEVPLLSLICGQSQKCPFSKTDSLETLFFFEKNIFFLEKNKNFFRP